MGPPCRVIDGLGNCLPVDSDSGTVTGAELACRVACADCWLPAIGLGELAGAAIAISRARMALHQAWRFKLSRSLRAGCVGGNRATCIAFGDTDCHYSAVYRPDRVFPAWGSPELAAIARHADRLVRGHRPHGWIEPAWRNTGIPWSRRGNSGCCGLLCMGCCLHRAGRLRHTPVNVGNRESIWRGSDSCDATSLDASADPA